MKLFIIDKYRISKYMLPEKIEETFLITYKAKNSNIENVITIDAEGNKWCLKSNGNVDVLNGKMITDKVILEENKYYNLKAHGINEEIILFCLPYYDKDTYDLDVKNLNSLSIGKSQSCNLIYNNPFTLDSHAEIKNNNGVWYLLSNKNALTFLNNTRVYQYPLKTGDVIFINGLKIIWMNSYIKINGSQYLTIKGLSILNQINNDEIDKLKPVPLDELNKSLYTEEEYFYHTPRLKSIIVEQSVQIDPPPQRESLDNLTGLLSIGSSITMAASSLMTGYTIIYGLSTGNKTLVDSIPQIIICISLILGCLIIPRIASYQKKKKKKEKEKDRIEQYTEYLKEKEKNINLIMKQQKQILLENNITAEECANIILRNKANIWVRDIKDDDFLNLRLGIGSCPVKIKLNAPEKHFTLDKDELFDSVIDVVNKTRMLEDIPITLSLTSHNICSLITNCKFEKQYIDGILLQLATLHSSLDLKIVIFTDEQRKDRWNYIKDFPHCWSDDKQIRFYSTCTEDSKEISNYLETEFKNRQDGLKNAGSDSYGDIKKEKGYKNFLPYYVIISDSYKYTKNIAIVNYILKEENNCGFSLLFLEHSMKNLPNKCENFATVLDTESCIFEKEYDGQNQKRFVAEYSDNLDMKSLSFALANIPVGDIDDNSELPKSISFLDVYGVSKIEQLKIQNRWENNNPVLSLSSPIGVHTNREKFELDLHEKYHGPHGLIAGSTGSGKSEFIISYILSMAINYHPNEVQFLLIDYKGGGLAGAFENKEKGIKLPHLIGTITNLDTATMNRALVSIDSELKRRQVLFNSVRDKLGESTIDIYKYQKFYREGIINVPMAHLFIICDEFAELKTQQPEFMNQLISTSRIGRSLGVHLILATQKPNGVVNDQIWSNSKFKVCLKVQDRADSVGVLKKPDAASIKDVGRFYLQVGYDDYFDIGQSGWCGAKYSPSDKIITKVDNSINFISNCGIVTKSVDDDIESIDEKTDDQLVSIVKYISDISDKQNIHPKQLWLDNIPEYIYLLDIEKKYGYTAQPYSIVPVIGEYDDPKKQSQNILTLDLTSNNTLIYGKVGSGKENLLSTIIFSSLIHHTPNEVNFYIIDFGAETLKIYSKIPHIGDIVLLDDSDKLMELITMLSNEIEMRKDLFSDYSGNYKSYCKLSEKKLPLIVIVINNYEVLSENYPKQGDALQILMRDGAKYGVVFIVTTSVYNSIRSRTVQNFDNRLSLQMANDTDYRLLLNAPKNLIPQNYFGRGIINIDSNSFEFQTAYIYIPEHINQIIKNYEKSITGRYSYEAKKIPVIPNIVSFDIIKPYLMDITKLPIGISIKDKMIYNYDFTANKTNLILSNEIYDKSKFIAALIKEIKYLNKDIKVIDISKLFKDKENTKDYYSSRFENILTELNNVDQEGFVFIIGLGEYNNKLNNVEINLLNNFFTIVEQTNRTVIVFDSYPSFKNIQMNPIIKTRFNNQNGIWLGEGAGSQIAININDFSLEDRKLNFPYMGVVVVREFKDIVKCVVLTEGDFDEE